MLLVRTWQLAAGVCQWQRCGSVVVVVQTRAMFRTAAALPLKLVTTCPAKQNGGETPRRSGSRVSFHIESRKRPFAAAELSGRRYCRCCRTTASAALPLPLLLACFTSAAAAACCN